MFVKPICKGIGTIPQPSLGAHGHNSVSDLGTPESNTEDSP